MAVVMEMPKLSDTMREGVVAQWLKKEGEKVQAGMPVIEIETDKATMEFESPASGVLLKILVGDKGACELSAPIAVIGKEGEDWQAALEAFKAKKSGASKKAATPQKPAASPQAQPAKGDVPPPPPAKGAPANPPETQQAAGDARIKVSPLARKVAQEKGINLDTLQGTGPNGRIIVRDVETLEPAEQANKIQASPSQAQATGDVERIPLSTMRKTIARRLLESVQTAPHFFLTISLNMGNILNWRKQVTSKLPDDQKFSVNDLLIFVLARALKKHSNINASWQEDHIAQYKNVHMSVAVALPNGLVTPVVRNADSLSVIEIGKKTRELVKLARDGKLQPGDYQGGTFSISNLGMAGIEEFTAIINPPQAAIIAVGATIPTPVVNDKGEVVAEQRMKITLSCDHRVIDGAQGAEFLKTFKMIVEDPMSLMLI